MKQFKTESKRILDLMIHSIYTNKEIFLRELISNASDAIDKLHFLSLTDAKVKGDFKIVVRADEAARTLTVSDNGIGMDKEALEKNLGTIAQSGTLAFKLEKEEDTNLIGQFGVGFYASFMVASKVVVESKAYGSDAAWRWSSEGAEGYNIEPCKKEEVGTTVTLLLKENDEDCKYDRFLAPYELTALIKKYSDYIRYPIVTDVRKSRKKEEGEGYEDYTEAETVNSMVPLWKKAKKEVSAEEYNDFYKNKFHDYTDPVKVISFNIEGAVNYTALLFVPAHAPFDYYSKDYQKGLQLYSNGVLIMDKCADLLPDYFGFVRGVVDSSDLSLNISREMLQQDRQLRAIASGIEKKLIATFKTMIEEERETYDKLFAEFGLSMKFGVYNDYGAKKDVLKDLIEFRSSTEGKLVTLKEYLSRMREGQECIYYACGESAEKIDRLPQTETVKEKGYEILYLTDNVDEFALRILDSYEEKKFKSVAAKDLNLASDEEKEAVKSKNEQHKELFELMKEALDGKVKDVRLSSRMKSYAACLTADGEISLEMEKVFKAMPGANPAVGAEKVLEINADHPILDRLTALYDTDRAAVKAYAKILYGQALLLEGFSVDDPAEFAALVTDVLVK